MNQPPPARRTRPRPYGAVVERVEEITPRMVRVTLGGEELSNFSWPGAASHLKIVLPEQGAVDVVLPPIGNGDAPVQEIAVQQPRRTYTPRRFDETTHTLDLEFVLHGEGPASDWAASAKPGMRVGVSQPRRSYDIDPTSRWLLIAGDESAIPAIGTILDARPSNLETTVLIEVDDADDEFPLGGDDRVMLRWLHRGTAPAGAPLEEAVRNWVEPSGPGQIWVACEAGAVRRIRHHLLAERSFPTDRVVTRGYWRIGESNHPDHDYGEDE